MTDTRARGDVFISYASEDRDAVAAPLAKVLQHLGVNVWFDKAELKVGDSLRERVDHGLAHSQFGVVILSPAFFGKHRPTRELNGLAQLEVEGRKVLLPIWHGLDERAVRAFSPPLADRVALSWTKGLYDVAVDLVEVVRPDLAKTLSEKAKRIVTLNPIISGKDLANLVGGSHMYQFFNEPAETREQSEELAAFLQQMQDWGDIWGDLKAGGRVEAEFSMQEALASIRESQWSVYGTRRKRKAKIACAVSDFDVAVLAVVKGTPPAVFMDGDGVIVPRTTTDAV
jgi:TIR domain